MSTERDTRQQIIDKRLEKAGWNVHDPSHVTEELDIVTDPIKTQDPKEKYHGHLFADYALLGKDGYPLLLWRQKNLLLMLKKWKSKITLVLHLSGIPIQVTETRLFFLTNLWTLMMNKK